MTQQVLSLRLNVVLSMAQKAKDKKERKKMKEEVAGLNIEA